MVIASENTVKRLRGKYPSGCRVKLERMSDPYMGNLHEGCEGTVNFVDDNGTIHVNWDCGSSLGVVYGVDACQRIEEKVKLYENN